MNGLYLMQVKNIRRISNVRKLSMYISVICADQRKAPKIHPQNTMQLILSSELNFKKQNRITHKTTETSNISKCR